MEVEDSEQLLEDLTDIIEHEAKESKEFYERQMREMPHFDDSYKVAGEGGLLEAGC